MGAPAADGGTVLHVQSNTGNGASIFGQNYQLQLSATSGRAAPTTDATQHHGDEFVRDTSDTLWFSMGNGTRAPGPASPLPAPPARELPASRGPSAGRFDGVRLRATGRG